MITIAGIVAVIVMMIISLLIAVLQSSKFENLNPINKDEEFLFGFNGRWYSILSNVGSLVSLSVFCAGGFVFGYTSGILSIFSVILAYIIAAIILLSAESSHPNFLYSNRKVISSYVGEKLGVHAQLFMILLIVLYSITIMGAEIFLLNEFLVDYLLIGKYEALILSLSSLGICYYYTKTGGYAGILRTDFMQTITIIVWIAITIFLWFNNKSYVLPPATSPDLAQHIKYYASIANNGLYNVIIYPILVVSGSCIYLLTLIMSSLGIWTTSFGTIESSKDRRFSISGSLILLLLFSLIPASLGSYYHVYSNGSDEFRIIFQIVGEFCLQRPIYLIFTVFTFTAIVITTIGSSIFSVLQHVNQLNKINNPKINRLINKNGLLTLQIVVGGTLSLCLSYKTIFLALMIIYNINLFSFYLIIVSVFTMTDVSHNDTIIYNIKKNMSKYLAWNNSRSIIIYFIIIVISIPVISMIESVKIFCLNNYHILPFIYYGTFAISNMIFKNYFKRQEDR